MLRTAKSFGFVLRALAALGIGAAPTLANVNLQLRPPTQGSSIGQTIEIGLYAVSDNTNIQFMASLGVILSWDLERLELVGINRAGEGYQWLNSFFPNDQSLDAINDDCPDGQFCSPYTGLPYNDGDGYYEAWGQFSPAPPPQATPGTGLLVTKFVFRALRSGVARVQIVPSLGSFTNTRVLSGVIPGREITGTLGPAVQVSIVSCAETPSAFAEGSRYLSVTPSPLSGSVALLVLGDLNDPKVDCVAGYIQPSGRLAETPVFRRPEEWSTVRVYDEKILPDSDYTIHTDCGTADAPDYSPGVAVRTWTWGDVNNSGLVDGDDIILVLNAAQGNFIGVTLPNVDQMGCLPDGTINADDILSVSDAHQGLPFPCPRICFPTLSLEDWADWLSCLGGPDVPLTEECTSANVDGDSDADLKDVAAFQIAFNPPEVP